ncbi:MAG: hypothetical protein WCJ37_14900 [Syntrophus sp. (in: bacteria)]
MKNKKEFLLRLDENLRVRLNRQAERLYSSQSAVLRMVLIKFLEEQAANGK